MEHKSRGEKWMGRDRREEGTGERGYKFYFFTVFFLNYFIVVQVQLSAIVRGFANK